MDTPKTAIYAGIGLAVALALWAAPVAAQEPPQAPDGGGRVNTLGVQSGQLPAPLPDMPPGVSLPDLNLPQPNAASWPSTAVVEGVVREDVETVVGNVNGVLTANYGFVLDRIYEARRVTNQVVQVIGSEDEPAGSFGIMSEGDEISATSLATDLAGAIRWTMAYMRGISKLGPLGLDLVFVFVGLGWIVLVNLADMAIRLAAWLIGIIGKVIAFAMKIVEVIFHIIGLILSVIEIIWPF